MNKQIAVLALYRKCREYLIKDALDRGGVPEHVAQFVTLSNVVARTCVKHVSEGKQLAELDAPRYMFAERPVTSSTWIDLQNMQLDTYMLVERTGLLIDPVTREYCYVFWDEGDQCSKPYATHNEALAACRRYIFDSSF